jgi:endonuclease/exonuclease/phosphatase family metal-dependent hydrolase
MNMASYRKMRHRAILLICVCLVPKLSASDIRIDGDFEDWRDVKTLACDPKGDAKAAFDITAVFATSQGATLYLRFDTGHLLNLQNGPKEEGTLQIVVDMPGNQQLILDTRGRRAHLNKPLKERIPWPHLRYMVGPTHAQDEFELQVDLSRFNVGPGDSVQIQFDGSDQLDSPLVYTFAQPVPEPRHRPHQRYPETDVRIVSFNAYVDGLSDPKRAPAMRRLLQAVDGDIYCFQEEWESTDIDKIVHRLTLLDSVGLKYVHKVHGNVLASKYPLRALSLGNTPYAAARIEIKGRSLVVMSVHLKAMGYIGSKEDLRRIQQAGVLLETVTEINRGDHNHPQQPDVKPAIVMVGDYNLVGSSTPVDLLAIKEITGLANWTLPHLVGESVITWRGGLRSSFAPGKLDYSLYSADRLTPRNGFVLDTERLSQTELDQLALEKTDSNASDHLLMVTDFQFKAL